MKLFTSFIVALAIFFATNDTAFCEPDRTAYFVVAASNAPNHVWEQADFQCDGVNDDIEINNALNSIPFENPPPTSDRRVVLSEGTFYCSNKLSVASKSIKIEGQGQAVTNLQFPDSDGIEITLGVGEQYSATIVDLTLLTGCNKTKTAIKVQGTNDGRTLFINNVALLPINPVEDSWQNGIVLSQVTNSIISNVQIRGGVPPKQLLKQFGLKNAVSI